MIEVVNAGIVYQTIKTTTNNILKPVIKRALNASNIILIIDESHVNDINMLEQLAFVKLMLSPKTDVPPAMRPFVVV